MAFQPPGADDCEIRNVEASCGRTGRVPAAGLVAASTSFSILPAFLIVFCRISQKKTMLQQNAFCKEKNQFQGLRIVAPDWRAQTAEARTAGLALRQRPNALAQASASTQG